MFVQHETFFEFQFDNAFSSDISHAVDVELWSQLAGYCCSNSWAY